MRSITIPSKFSELENLADDDLRKLVRMVTAVLNERSPKEKKPLRSNKIERAFHAIPTTPVDALDFALKHKISINTLRQQKRFDPLKDTGVGTVYIRKNPQDGKLYVWRGLKGGLKPVI